MSLNRFDFAERIKVFLFEFYSSISFMLLSASRLIFFLSDMAALVFHFVAAKTKIEYFMSADEFGFMTLLLIPFNLTTFGLHCQRIAKSRI